MVYDLVYDINGNVIDVRLIHSATGGRFVKSKMPETMLTIDDKSYFRKSNL